MNELFQYLIQSSASLAILYGVYWLFLRSETFFSMNRYFLLFCAVVSFLIPFFRFNFYQIEMVRSAIIYLDPILITPDRAGTITSNHFKLVELAKNIYFSGIMFFTLRFIIQVIQLLIIVMNNGIARKTNGMNIILVDKQFSTFSFFNFVFLSIPDKNNQELTAILDHEGVHVRQKHSLDLLLIEILQIVLWFNPFVWLLRRSIKTIHEFLADEGVLKTGYNTHAYQYLLINMASGIQVSGLSNNFNFSLLKKRIIMMTKSRSATMAKGKILFVLPALMALVFFFSLGSFSNLIAQDTKPKAATKPAAATTAATPTNASQTTPKSDSKIKFTEPVFKVVEKQPSYTGGDDARIKFLVENIKYPEVAMKKGIRGTVYVTFVVKSDGSVSDVKVLRGIGGGCDQEAVRVVKLMPKWIPGEDKGKPVNVQYNLPIKFALN